MTTIMIPKETIKERREVLAPMVPRLTLKKHWKTWQKLAGIWKNRKVVDPVRWQKSIRRASR